MKEYWVSSKEEKEYAEVIADALATAIALVIADDIKLAAKSTVGKSKEIADRVDSIADRVDSCSRVVGHDCSSNKYHFGTNFKADLQTLKALFSAERKNDMDVILNGIEFANAAVAFSEAYDLTEEQVICLIK